MTATQSKTFKTSKTFRAEGRAALKAHYGEAFDASVFERAMRKTDRFATLKYGKGLWACYGDDGKLIEGLKKDRWGCEFGECEFHNLFVHYAECLRQPTGTRTYGHALAQERRASERFARERLSR